MKHAFLALFVAVLALSNIASAHTVTMNLALRIGNNVNNTVHVNDTDYNTTTPTSLTFVNPNKRYISSNNTTSLTALVSAGSLLYIRMNNSYNSTHYLFQMTQDSVDNRFLIAATNGTASDIDNHLDMISTIHMVSSTFGRFAANVPASFPTFIRLEYADINLEGRSFWSGIGQLRIRNRGLTNRNIPNITLEVVRT